MSENVQQDPSNPIIEVSELSKVFGEVIAVNSLDFSVKPGRTIALLGGNGAGKTTTLSMLLGLLLPTRGTVKVFGADMAKDRYAVLHRINFTSPYVDLPQRLTALENLIVYARLYGIPHPKERVMALSEDLELQDFLKRPVSSLSAGQKTRVGLAKALLNQPDALFLDEPTASLDPDTGDWVRGYLEAYQKSAGAAILLASHNMSEVERLADHVLMIKKGAIVDQGAPETLVEKYGRSNLEEVFLEIARGTEASQSSDPHGGNV